MEVLLYGVLQPQIYYPFSTNEPIKSNNLNPFGTNTHSCILSSSEGRILWCLHSCKAVNANLGHPLLPQPPVLQPTLSSALERSPLSGMDFEEVGATYSGGGGGGEITKDHHHVPLHKAQQTPIYRQQLPWFYIHLSICMCIHGVILKNSMVTGKQWPAQIRRGRHGMQSSSINQAALSPVVNCSKASHTFKVTAGDVKNNMLNLIGIAPLTKPYLMAVSWEAEQQVLLPLSC